MPSESMDSFKVQKNLESQKGIFFHFSLKALEHQGLGDIQRLPCLLKLLLENLLQFEEGKRIHKIDIKSLARAVNHIPQRMELAFHPVRLWLERMTDLSSLATLLAYRATENDTDLQCGIDWMCVFSEQQDKTSYEAFLKQFESIPNFEINLNPIPEWLHFKKQGEKVQIFQESLIGTGRHIAIANAFGVLALQVGALEAEAVMLNQPLYLGVPKVLGIKLEGSRREALSSKVCVNEILQALKQKDISGRWLEFYGAGLGQLSHEERVLIAEGAMALGAACAFFPVDENSLQAMSKIFQDPDKVELIHSYVLSQGLWRDHTTPDPVFNETLCLDFAQFGVEAFIEDVFSKTECNTQAVKIPEVIIPNAFLETEAFCLNQVKILFPEQIVQCTNAPQEAFVLVTEHINETAFGNSRINRKTFPSSIKAILAEQFDSAHRADLIRLGIMPLIFKFGMSQSSLQIAGDEQLDFVHLSRQMKPGMDVLCRMTRKSGAVEEFVLKCGIETQRELEYFRCGGILGYVLRNT